jgi:tetratricopeptide (TPR) repeat protein
MIRIGLQRLLISLLVVPCFVLASTARSQAIDAWDADARSAIDSGAWDEAIRILDPVLAAEPNLMDARLLRAISYREKADYIVDNVRAQYYLDPSEVTAIWEAVRGEMRGQRWELEFGRDYDVARAISDFETILAADSTFGGALWAYAKLWHDHHIFDRAIELGEAQLALDPGISEAHEELIESYRHYIAWTSNEKALEWLDEHATPYAKYFIGEVYRHSGQLESADAHFASILDRRLEMPPQPVLLSLAKIRISQERYEAAHAFVEQAMEFESPVQARLLYRDFFYIMDVQEYEEAQTLSTVDGYRDFYQRLLARRNPTPGSRINWRLVEHYRRLVTAESEYEYYGARRHFRQTAASDSPVMQPTFPPMYNEAHGVNDKGLIYIRHGEPDEKVATVDGNMNESWRYVNAGLDFHFMISEIDGIAYSWPLVPYLDGCRMADDRRHWGPLYSQIAPRVKASDPTDVCGEPSDSPIAVIQARDRLAKVGQAHISKGLTTDRHTWTTRDVESFDFPFDLVTFRGVDGQTDVSAYFALPVGWFSEAVPSNILPVRIGFALHDTMWQSVAERSVVREFESSPDRTKAGFEALHVSVAPDSYRVSLHSELFGSDMIGGYQFGRKVPDYAGTETMMSDVILAYEIRPIPGHIPSVRSSLQFVANPFHRFATDQQVHVYFELYRLLLDENDTSQYEVTYRIEPEGPGGIRGLLRRDEPALSVSAGFEDDSASPIVFSQIDVSELDPGVYTLVVRVTDSMSGEVVSKRLSLELAEPEE